MLTRVKDDDLTAASMKDREDSLVRSGFKHSPAKVIDARRGSAGSHRSYTATGMARLDTPVTAYSHWLEKGNTRLKGATRAGLATVASFDMRERKTI